MYVGKVLFCSCSFLFVVCFLVCVCMHFPCLYVGMCFRVRVCVCVALFVFVPRACMNVVIPLFPRVCMCVVC